MTRWVSLFLLLVVIAATGYMLYRVMAGFLLPLFLAVVLAVIFRPLHQWILRTTGNREHVAALLTTLTILATVLVPMGAVLGLAIHEGLYAVRGNVLQRVENKVGNLRQSLRLNLPFETFPDQTGNMVEIDELESLLSRLPDELPHREDVTAEQRNNISLLLHHIEALQDRLQLLREEIEGAAGDREFAGPQQRIIQRLLKAKQKKPFDELAAIRETLVDVESYLAGTPSPPDSLETASEATQAATPEMELDRRYARLKADYRAFRLDLLGGPIWSWARNLANPTSHQMEVWMRSAETYLSGWLPSLAGQATALVGQILISTGIMALALFYFLKDGPAMIRALMWLSPMDDRHEEELLMEFASVSRAVVLATLLSALAQGLLAAPAYYLAGFNSVFLLMMLTMLLAMVPFIGAAAVWFPACLWLAFAEQRFAAAGALLVYGVVIISMADNIVKPYVLAGRSRLHPLLGLLSVLGGVQALGPIGILVGPMIVSFLQALLTILNQQLAEFEDSAKVSQPQPA